MIRLTLILAGLAAASALCPNACSGHGECGEYDMCTCYAGYQANDCSERTCPFATAFTTTPNGDLNMDGDRYDNTQKLLVKSVGGLANQGTIVENDDILTLNKDINTGEVVVGDAIRIGDETFVIDALVSGKNNQFSLDHDRFTGITTEVNVYKFLENIPSPMGTWESWAGDYAKDDEGHFYMECANRGQCDRKTGECECFDGYSGAACHRQACPNDCSGHGTCESVSELVRHNATSVTVDQQGFYVHTATAGSSTVTISENPTTLAVGDVIRLNDRHGQDLTVMKSEVSSSVYTLTVSPALDVTAPYGSRIYLVAKYAMWDADMNRACVCDTPYTGGDCSLRACPKGDDPLTVFTTIGAADQTELGVTSVRQRNEKQNLYFETARGSLSGTFTLTFTDAFGQKWTTDPVYINERLSSKAYVDSTSATTVTFSPSLPYGELEAGDFLMIGDERQEVLTTYPITDYANGVHRPTKLGGVVDSVLVKNIFSAASTNVYCFRAGPAKGIKKALEALPNGVVPSVNAERFNSGQLIGHHLQGISTTSGLTTIAGVLGDFDQQDEVGANSGREIANVNEYGGIAPYDMIRVVADNGKSEFMQVRNVDVFPTNGVVEQLMGKGVLTAKTGSTSAVTASSAKLGIGAGNTGAIYRDGGHHVRVTFLENPGDLPEMECDDSGIYSVFFREFTGTVYAAEPRKVYTRLHGDLQFHTDTTYLVPPAPFDTGSGSEYGHGNNNLFAGDRNDLKLMAGMRVKLGDQVRTVVETIDSDSSTAVATFMVDADFESCAVSETVDNVDYLFYKYPVEQIYDEAAYAALTISRAAIHTTENSGEALTLSAQGGGALWADQANLAKLTIGATPAANAAAGWKYGGVSGNVHTHLGTAPGSAFPIGSQICISGGSDTTPPKSCWVTSFADTDHWVASCADAAACSTAAAADAYAAAAGWAVRSYDMLTARAHATTAAEASPPLYRDFRTNWVSITDQRPLVWASPARAYTTQSRMIASPSLVAKRGIVAAGSNAITLTLDGTVHKLASTSTTVVWSGTGSVNFEHYFFGYFSGAATDQDFYMTISGCSADTEMNTEFPVTGVTSTTLTFSAPESGNTISSKDPVCAGNTVTITSRMGSLIDPKAIAIEDRVKFEKSASVYETRTVDKIWGTALDVTMFSVVDAYTNMANLQNANAWVDESGSTEEIECSRRGLCEQESGECKCFSGYTSNNCGTQNALAS